MIKKALKFNEMCELYSPTEIPKASGFLWNDRMMIHMNCRGYAVAQFMQPEPAKYAHGPALEATTFMQPEQPYFTHHPGRFIYVKDEENGVVFSVPYEPTRSPLHSYIFRVEKSMLSWQVELDGISIEFSLSLSEEDAVELWKIKVLNKSGRNRAISIYPYFTVGYMSWMNQSAKYNTDLGGIVCSSVTPYQKYTDAKKIMSLKDQTFLIGDREPDAFETRQETFEGEGGLFNPTAICGEYLSNGEANYEMPLAVFQYRLAMKDKEEETFRLLFGPSKNIDEIQILKKKYFEKDMVTGLVGFDKAVVDYKTYIEKGQGCLKIRTPDKHFDSFVNHWLPRQMYYHGISNRLSTDPQTRNYLQDNMGMSYILPEIARKAFITALSQQSKTGSMPDGILLNDKAELKYINQVPHTDHCVWLPICISAYLDETGDTAFLNEKIHFSDSLEQVSVLEHVNMAMEWLIKSCDERGLSYINQGDWCDPMNMVGYKGKGVSGWLTLATAYALKLWAGICLIMKKEDLATKFKDAAMDMNNAINKFMWDGNWYARGITDDGVSFGIEKDKEGKIYLNPQSWSILSGAADRSKQKVILDAVETYLDTPYGMQMLSPAYTSMREDVGRITQKFPGTAENGSVYNHAGIFYIYSLYSIGEKNKAFNQLKKMVVGPDEKDMIKRKQLPTFIPNYYRGAFSQIPEVSGQSSQLFNTGTVQWYYRCLVEGLFGLKGSAEGLVINSQLPDIWDQVTVERSFRGANFIIEYIRTMEVTILEIYLDGQRIKGNVIHGITKGKTYKVMVKIPSINI